MEPQSLRRPRYFPLKDAPSREDIYGFDCFHGLPILRGWAQPEDPSAWCICEDTEEIMARAQSWLYFGLLSEFLREPLDIKEFMLGPFEEQSQTEIVPYMPMTIDTSKVESVVAKRTSTLNNAITPGDNYDKWFSSIPSRSDAFDRTVVCCGTASRHIQAFEEVAMRRGSALREPMLVTALAVKTLIESLQFGYYTHCFLMRKNRQERLPDGK
jgi:hypothetical protein